MIFLPYLNKHSTISLSKQKRLLTYLIINFKPTNCKELEIQQINFQLILQINSQIKEENLVVPLIFQMFRQILLKIEILEEYTLKLQDFP